MRDAACCPQRDLCYRQDCSATDRTRQCHFQRAPKSVLSRRLVEIAFCRTRNTISSRFPGGFPEKREAKNEPSRVHPDTGPVRCTDGCADWQSMGRNGEGETEAIRGIQPLACVTDVTTGTRNCPWDDDD